MSWTNNIENLNAVLLHLSVRDRAGKEVEPDSAFLSWKNLTLRARENRKTVYLIGNGASASMASHIAADLAKNARVRTEVFTDLSLITAVGNDLSYEDVFAEPLRIKMTEGDMLIAISSSGQSPNVIKAIQEATRLGGLVITLSAMKRNNTLQSQGILNFYVPAESYGMAETSHAAILHYWVDQMVATKTENTTS